MANIRLLIYGSRTWAPTIEEVEDVATACFYPRVGDPITLISCVVSGNARGADRSGEAWADECTIPIERYPADWKKHGKAAGPIRNEEMAGIVTHAIGFRDDGEFPGTDDMSARLARRGVPFRVVSRAMVARLAEKRGSRGDGLALGGEVSS